MTFLNWELEEEIYMDLPDRFVTNGQEGNVRKLLNSLDGLKQRPKQWHEKFYRTLTSDDFVMNEYNFSSRWTFNLIASIKTLVCQTSGNESFSFMP